MEPDQYNGEVRPSSVLLFYCLSLHCLLKIYGFVGCGSVFLIPESSHTAALADDPSKIQVCTDAGIFKPVRLYQTGAVFRNDILSAKYQILG